MDFPGFRLDDRVALVTGAGQGIGRAIALGFAHAGATVVATDHNEGTLRGVADELAGARCEAMSLRLDVGEAAAITPKGVRRKRWAPAPGPREGA